MISIKSVNSITATEKQERYVLVFDFETNDLPVDNWGNFEPSDSIKKWKDGNPVYLQTPIMDKDTGNQVIDYRGNPMYTRKTIPLPASNVKDWPYAVQFCYILYDTHTHTIVELVNEIVRLPDDPSISMSLGSEKIHGISAEKSRGKTKRVVDSKTGIVKMVHHPYIDELLPMFMSAFLKADVVVAHNLRFDRNVLLAELTRMSMRSSLNADLKVYIDEVYSNKKEYCTGDFGADVCEILAKNSSGKSYYKMPRLSELYNTLFNYVPSADKMHDAFVDVVVCMRCFLRMRCASSYSDSSLPLELIKVLNSISPVEYQIPCPNTSIQSKPSIVPAPSSSSPSPLSSPSSSKSISSSIRVSARLLAKRMLNL